MKNLQNLYWAESGDLVAIASDTSFYILKYNVRICSTSNVQLLFSFPLSWIVQKLTLVFLAITARVGFLAF